MKKIELNTSANNVNKKKFKHYTDPTKNPCFGKNMTIYQSNVKVIDDNFRRDIPNGFLQTLEYSFDEHLPIALRPDDIWLLVLQGLSQHERVTKKLGQVFGLEGKEHELHVRRTDNPLDAPVEVYEQIFPEFVKLMASKFTDKEHVSHMFPVFSTSNALSQAVFSVSLMDTFKQYFSYHNCFMCNIPVIYVDGVKDDWVKLLDNLKYLSKCGLGLEFWIENIIPCVQKFIDVCDGKVDKEFWKSIFRSGMQSGGDVINGWIMLFLPYLQKSSKGDLRKNDWKFESFVGGNNRYWGIDFGNIPSAYSACPLVWEGMGKKVNCRVFTGSFGPMFDHKKKCLYSSLGWVVAKDNKQIAQ